MISSIEEEFKIWVDQDGLIGNKPHPEKWSTGNALLETAFAVKTCERLGLKNLAASLKQAMANCWYNNALHKNPNRTDQITHDDLIGFAASDKKFARLICDVGTKNGWDLSNGPDSYYTAHAKPWHQSFYLAATRGEYVCGLWDSIIFWSFAFVSVLSSSYSGLRLTYLMVDSIKSSAISKAWKAVFKVRHKNLKQVQQEYYSDAGHINAKHAQD